MSCFKFKGFTVFHDRCAMKVGTDGVLLGAWARGGARILDVGTGSGLIALFMAQRFPQAAITAIDIDAESVQQARENFLASPHGDRIVAVEVPLQGFREGKYDAIVCNPPFFVNSLRNPDRRKAQARHADTLPFRDLFEGVDALLGEDGEFSVIIPSTAHADFSLEAAAFGMFPLRECAIKTTPQKQVSRYLLSYGKRPATCVESASACLSAEDGTSRSEWFSALTEDFYF